MNAGMSFVAIVSISLAMALAGGTAKKQADVNSPASRIITPSRIAINHNETLVSDAAVVQQADALSQWLTSLQVFVFNRFSSFATGKGLPGGCDEFGCGMNHNETMLSDTMSVQQGDALSQWLTSLQVFIFDRFSIYAAGGRLPGCDDEFGCGTNHNETMVSDAISAQQADASSQWLTSVQVFIFNRFSSYAAGGRLPGGCDEWGCGSNHNETMLSDTMSVQQADVLSQWLTRVQAFFFSRPISGGCDEWGCGTNHNETLVRDTDS